MFSADATTRTQLQLGSDASNIAAPHNSNDNASAIDFEQLSSRSGAADLVTSSGDGERLVAGDLGDGVDTKEDAERLARERIEAAVARSQRRAARRAEAAAAEAEAREALLSAYKALPADFRLFAAGASPTAADDANFKKGRSAYAESDKHVHRAHQHSVELKPHRSNSNSSSVFGALREEQQRVAEAFDRLAADFGRPSIRQRQQGGGGGGDFSSYATPSQISEGGGEGEEGAITAEVVRPATAAAAAGGGDFSLLAASVASALSSVRRYYDATVDPPIIFGEGKRPILIQGAKPPAPPLSTASHDALFAPPFPSAAQQQRSNATASSAALGISMRSAGGAPSPSPPALPSTSAPAVAANKRGGSRGGALSHSPVNAANVNSPDAELMPAGGSSYGFYGSPNTCSAPHSLRVSFAIATGASFAHPQQQQQNPSFGFGGSNHHPLSNVSLSQKGGGGGIVVNPSFASSSMLAPYLNNASGPQLTRTISRSAANNRALASNAGGDANVNAADTAISTSLDTMHNMAVTTSGRSPNASPPSPQVQGGGADRPLRVRVVSRHNASDTAAPDSPPSPLADGATLAAISGGSAPDDYRAPSPAPSIPTTANGFPFHSTSATADDQSQRRRSISVNALLLQQRGDSATTVGGSASPFDFEGYRADSVFAFDTPNAAATHLLRSAAPSPPGFGGASITGAVGRWSRRGTDAGRTALLPTNNAALGDERVGEAEDENEEDPIAAGMARDQRWLRRLGFPVGGAVWSAAGPKTEDGEEVEEEGDCTYLHTSGGDGGSARPIATAQDSKGGELSACITDSPPTAAAAAVTAALDRLRWAAAVNEALRQQMRNAVAAHKADLRTVGEATPKQGGTSSTGIAATDATVRPLPADAEIRELLTQVFAAATPNYPNVLAAASSDAVASQHQQQSSGAAAAGGGGGSGRGTALRWLPGGHQTARTAAAQTALLRQREARLLADAAERAKARAPKGQLSASARKGVGGGGAHQSPSSSPPSLPFSIGYPLLVREGGGGGIASMSQTTIIAAHCEPTGDAAIDADRWAAAEALSAAEEKWTTATASASASANALPPPPSAITITDAEEEELRTLLGGAAVDYLLGVGAGGGLFGAAMALLGPQSATSSGRRGAGNTLHSRRASVRDASAVSAFGNASSFSSALEVTLQLPKTAEALFAAINSVANATYTTANQSSAPSSATSSGHHRRSERRRVGNLLKQYIGDALRWAVLRGKLRVEKSVGGAAISGASPTSPHSPVASAAGVAQVPTIPAEIFALLPPASLPLVRLEAAERHTKTSGGTAEKGVNTVRSATMGLRQFEPPAEALLNFRPLASEVSNGAIGGGGVGKQKPKGGIRQQPEEDRFVSGAVPSPYSASSQQPQQQQKQQQQKRREFTDLAPLINGFVMAATNPVGAQEARQRRHCELIAARGASCFVLPFPLTADDGAADAAAHAAVVRQRHQRASEQKKRTRPLLTRVDSDEDSEGDNHVGGLGAAVRRKNGGRNRYETLLSDEDSSEWTDFEDEFAEEEDYLAFARDERQQQQQQHAMMIGRGGTREHNGNNSAYLSPSALPAHEAAALHQRRLERAIAEEHTRGDGDAALEARWWGRRTRHFYNPRIAAQQLVVRVPDPTKYKDHRGDFAGGTYGPLPEDNYLHGASPHAGGGAAMWMNPFLVTRAFDIDHEKPLFGHASPNAFVRGGRAAMLGNGDDPRGMAASPFLTASQWRQLRQYVPYKGFMHLGTEADPQGLAGEAAAANAPSSYNNFLVDVDPAHALELDKERLARGAFRNAFVEMLKRLVVNREPPLSGRVISPLVAAAAVPSSAMGWQQQRRRYPTAVFRSTPSSDFVGDYHREAGTFRNNNGPSSFIPSRGGGTTTIGGLYAANISTGGDAAMSHRNSVATIAVAGHGRTSPSSSSRTIPRHYRNNPAAPFQQAAVHYLYTCDAAALSAMGSAGGACAETNAAALADLIPEFETYLFGEDGRGGEGGDAAFLDPLSIRKKENKKKMKNKRRGRRAGKSGDSSSSNGSSDGDSSDWRGSGSSSSSGGSSSSSSDEDAYSSSRPYRPGPIGGRKRRSSRSVSIHSTASFSAVPSIFRRRVGSGGGPLRYPALQYCPHTPIGLTRNIYGHAYRMSSWPPPAVVAPDGTVKTALDDGNDDEDGSGDSKRQQRGGAGGSLKREVKRLRRRAAALSAASAKKAKRGFVDRGVISVGPTHVTVRVTGTAVAHSPASTAAGGGGIASSSPRGGGGDSSNHFVRIPLCDIVEVVLGHSVGFLPTIRNAARAAKDALRAHHMHNEGTTRSASAAAATVVAPPPDPSLVSPHDSRVRLRREELRVARRIRRLREEEKQRLGTGGVDPHQQSVGGYSSNEDDDDEAVDGCGSGAEGRQRKRAYDSRIGLDVDPDAMTADGGDVPCDSIRGLTDRYYQCLTIVYAPEAAHQRAKLSSLFDPFPVTAGRRRHPHQPPGLGSYKGAQSDASTLFSPDAAGALLLDRVPLREAYVSVIVDSKSEWNAIVTALMNSEATVNAASGSGAGPNGATSAAAASSGVATAAVKRPIPIRFAGALPLARLIRESAKATADRLLFSHNDNNDYGISNHSHSSHKNRSLSPADVRALEAAEATVAALESLRPDELRFCECFHVTPLLFAAAKKHILSAHCRPLKAFEGLTAVLDIDFFRLQQIVSFFEERGWVRLHTVYRRKEKL